MAETAAAEGTSFRDKNPWIFIPMLYFMQALPVILVMEGSGIVYKSLGIENVAITQWTSLITLPWSIKLLWGPLIEVNGTKRAWTLGMQLLIAAAIAAVAFAMNTPNFFGFTLGLLFVVAIFSATCDIATDGYYILSFSKKDQARFIGFNSTFFRLGRLFVLGGIVKLAGILIERGMDRNMAWMYALLALAVVYGLGRIVNQFTMTKPVQDVPLVHPDERDNARNIARTFGVLASAGAGYFALSGAWRLLLYGAYNVFQSERLDLSGWALTAEQAPVHFFRIGPYRLLEIGSTVNTQLARLIVCGALAVFFAQWTVRVMRGTLMGDAFKTFFAQPGIVAILGFVMFYRFGEVMVGRIAPLFLLDPASSGGLGLTESQVANANGIAGVIGIVAGGILGGFYVSKFGLRKAFVPLVLAMNVPNLMYLWAAWADRVNEWAIYGILFIDQFGYGFGFAGYMVYLMYVAQRSRYQTAHYAIATGLGATLIMTAGILSGIIQRQTGYFGFFLTVMFFTAPAMLILWFIPLDDTEGRGIQVTEVE